MEISKKFDVDPFMVRGMIRKHREVDLERIVAERMLSWRMESFIAFLSEETDIRRNAGSRSVSELSEDIRTRIKDITRLNDSFERKMELAKMVYFIFSRRRTKVLDFEEEEEI